MKKVAILGSTGSIGRTALNVIKKYKSDFEIILLANGSNVELLKKQGKEFNVKTLFSSAGYLCVDGEEKAFDSEFLSRPETYKDVDIVINGIVGIAGFLPTIATIDAGKILATANKESFVVGGNIISNRLKKSNTKIHPMDSEHSTIWQCIDNVKNVKSIILTASGGAFRDYTKEQLLNAKAYQALCHPTWVMGKKVTIDCATLMNKGMEIIEAKHIFGIENIKVVMHRESIIHSLVEMHDNTLIAGLSHPDMTIPIQYALYYPERKESSVKSLDLSKIVSLNFGTIDEEKFPCFNICKRVASKGDYAGCVMNSANEVLVENYIKNKVRFYDISDGIQKSLLKFGENGNIRDIIDINRIDKEVREYTFSNII